MNYFYRADESNNRIRRISASGDVTTIAEIHQDTVMVLAEALNSPMGIAFMAYNQLHCEIMITTIRSVLVDSNLTSSEEVKFSLAGGYNSYNIASSISNNGSSTGDNYVSYWAFTKWNIFVKSFI